MDISDAFQTEAIVNAGVGMSGEEADELSTWLSEVLTEQLQPEEGEVSVETAVTFASLAFVAGRAYQSDQTTVAVEMTHDTLHQFLNYLSERLA